MTSEKQAIQEWGLGLKQHGSAAAVARIRGGDGDGDTSSKI